MRKMDTDFKISIILVIIVVLIASCTHSSFVYAKAKPKLSKKSISMYAGTTTKLKMKNTKKKVKWYSTKKSVATVSKKGVVKAKKPGKAKIIAKIGKKHWVCKVKVIAQKNKPLPFVNVRIDTPLPFDGYERLPSGTRYTYTITNAYIKYLYYSDSGTYAAGVFVSGVRNNSKDGEQKIAIGWKLLDANKGVIDSGKIVTPDIGYQDKFTDAGAVISSSLEPGQYYLQFYNYRW